MTETRPTEMERRLHEITQKHFTNCLWQTRVGPRMMVECMNFPSAGTTAIVSCWYETNLPRKSGGAKWPKLSAYDIYVPADRDGIGTHDATDEALSEMTRRHEGGEP